MIVCQSCKESRFYGVRYERLLSLSEFPVEHDIVDRSTIVYIIDDDESETLTRSNCIIGNIVVFAHLIRHLKQQIKLSH